MNKIISFFEQPDTIKDGAKGPLRLFMSFKSDIDGALNDYHRYSTDADKAKYSNEYAAYEAGKPKPPPVIIPIEESEDKESEDKETKTSASER